MAYSDPTSIANAADLIDRIVSFAGANGWTVERNSLDGANRTATLRKVGVSDYVHLYNTDPTTVRMRISIGYDDELPIADQPNVSNQAVCTLLAGPYPRAFMFASGDQVWVSVAIARSGEYRHLTFGVVDKMGTFEGGTYVDGSSWPGGNWWANFNNNHAPFLSLGSGTTRGHVRVDIPADERENFFFSFSATNNNTRVVSDAGEGTGALAAALVNRADRNAFSGRSVLHAIPLYVARTGSQTFYSPIGVVQDVRYCSINKFEPEQEITIGSDTWVVFPVAAKRPLNSTSGEQPAASGDYAYAIRKVL